VEKDLGILEDNELNVGQQCALTLKRLTASWTGSSRSIVTTTFKLALGRPHLGNGIESWAPLVQEIHG